MRVQVQKWGNGLAIRTPKTFAKETKIEQGSVVDLSAVKGILIAKLVNEYEYSLEELLAGVTNENRHAEIDTGDAIGQEVW